MTSMKLNPSTRRILKALKYNPSSRMKFMFLPFSGPYWEDEGIDHLRSLTPSGKSEVIALFVARMKLWMGTPLSQDEEALWSQCRCGFPECPIFKRLEVTPEIMKALGECAEGTMSFFKGFGEGTQVDVKEEKYGLVEITRHPKPLKKPGKPKTK